jgi:hypothetical protein
MEVLGTIMGGSKRERGKTRSVFPNIFEFLVDLTPRLAAKDIGK